MIPSVCFFTGEIWVGGVFNSATFDVAFLISNDYFEWKKTQQTKHNFRHVNFSFLNDLFCQETKREFIFSVALPAEINIDFVFTQRRQEPEILRVIPLGFLHFPHAFSSIQSRESRTHQQSLQQAGILSWRKNLQEMLILIFHSYTRMVLVRQFEPADRFLRPAPPSVHTPHYVSLPPSPSTNRHNPNINPNKPHTLLRSFSHN